MAAKGKKSLAIVASVDGAGNVVKSIDSIGTAVAGVGNATNDTTKELSGIGSAFDKLGGSQVAQVTSKLSPLIDGMGKLGSQVNAAGKGIGGMLGLLGPWGLAIGFAVDAATKLYDVLAEGEKTTEAAKTSVDDLTAAYDRLGTAADILAARQQVSYDKTLERAKATVNAANEAYSIQQRAVQAAEAELAVKEGAARAAARDQSASAWVVQGAQQAADLARQSLRTQQDLLKVRYEQLDAALRQYDADKARAGLAAQQAAEAKAAEDARKRAEDEAERKAKEAEARAKEAAAKRAAEIAAEEAYVKQLRQRTEEEIFALQEHSDLERLDRQTELALQAAEAAIKDEYQLAAARDAIWEADAAKRQAIETAAAKRGAEEREKWITEARKRSTQQLASGDASDAEVVKLTDRIDKLGEDLQRFRAMSESELAQYADDYQATQDALVSAEEARTARYQQLAIERGQAIAREAAEAKKARMEQIRANYALTDSQRETVKAQQDGLAAITEGLEAWGKGATIIKAAQMTASGIQAVCDAIDYGAEAAANFAVGNIAAGVGLTAAAAGKTAAAAAYAKSLAELGMGGFDTGGASQSQAQTGTSQVTGQAASSRTTEISVTMQFAGQAGRLGRYLIDDINAEANTPGGARIESRVLR